ncbi:MAG: YgiQ family radical SAM protein [Spirochaetales bacterium]|nr:YgiQ family radical SAM protein [Spirochaetales bacterium]
MKLKNSKTLSFLPTTKKEMDERGWEECDFILISGDAYVDHPSFGTAIIGRVLEAEGFRVGILDQPDCSKPDSEDFKRLGKPRYAWLISSGNMDSMVNHYTANRRLRSEDAYSPGGKRGKRPDRAVLAYTSRAKAAYKGVPVILGGIEASLRRLSHYDYWSDKLRKSLLIDSKADFIVYGMGEETILRLARDIKKGKPLNQMVDIPGTLYRCSSKTLKEAEELSPWEFITLPPFEKLVSQKELFAQSFKTRLDHNNPFRKTALVEESAGQFTIENPPPMPISREEFDRVYNLPFTHRSHPKYEGEGGVPALKEVRFSLVSSRGCFGNCAFCALAFHQGVIVSSRSKESIIKEAKEMIAQPDFKGYINDVGGPTANFRDPACSKQLKSGACTHRTCLGPEPCPQLEVDHRDYVSLLRDLRHLEGVKKVFVRSGVRFDYAMLDKDDTFLRELCEHHISGQLKVAPEHTSDRVLKIMGKPPARVYRAFEKKFYQINRELGKKQYLIPYLIASHPGSTLKDALITSEELRKSGFVPDQIQDFYPTPGTVSSCIYYSGIDPRNGKEVFVEKKERERKKQRALLQYNRRENEKLVVEALKDLKRQDLIPVYTGKRKSRKK